MNTIPFHSYLANKGETFVNPILCQTYLANKGETLVNTIRFDRIVMACFRRLHSSWLLLGINGYGLYSQIIQGIRRSRAPLEVNPDVFALGIDAAFDTCNSRNIYLFMMPHPGYTEIQGPP